MALTLCGIGANVGSKRRARSKQLRRFEAGKGVYRDGWRRLRKRQRRDAVDDFARYSQWFPARRHNPQRRRFGQKRLHDLGARRHQVFARVEDKEEITVAQCVN